MAVSSPVRAPAALRDRLRGVLGAVLASRLLVWLVAMPVALVADYSFWRERSDPTNMTGKLGDVGEILGAPAFRWDSVYYVQIAQDGYTQLKQAGFFPLYPYVVGIVDTVTRSTVVAGVLVSLVGFAAGLWLFERLAILETGREDVARWAVWLLALFPASLFFSAVYTEGLFLLLSVGAFLAARRGTWWAAGLLGGLAAMTRNVGVMLLVPLVLLYLWGPREDRPGERGRFPIRADILWLALVPLGTALVAGLMWHEFDDAFTAWNSQNTYFHRSFEGPFSGVWLGIAKAFEQTTDLEKWGNVAVALGAIGGSIAMLWRLPLAYGLYALAVLAPSLSTPNDVGPLNGTIRYVAVVFPLFLWLALVLESRPRLRWACVAAFVLGLAYCSAAFATWRFVA